MLSPLPTALLPSSASAAAPASVSKIESQNFTNSPNVKQLLVEAAYRFSEAEALLKRVERINVELPIPLINELRHAGAYISRYVLEPDTVKMCEEIQKAIHHCECVKFDAYELMLTYYLDNFMQFFEQYGNTTICLEDVIPNYNEARSFIRNVRDFVQQHSDVDGRIQFTVHAKGYLEDLKPLWDVFDDAREAIWKKAQKKRFGVLLAVGSLGVMLSAAAVCVVVFLVFP